ncbi:hypothetical protein BN2497_8993 [Janthinobacterium sp. CG23_2]|nr:hypothetical protein BN2497_8993 [Janthinobacterium sp. CG23_2]CUU30894.1 hypothetical protein BN3177_8993 [Janthinobacterium sp. CG23_2]
MFELFDQWAYRSSCLLATFLKSAKDYSKGNNCCSNILNENNSYF